MVSTDPKGEAGASTRLCICGLGTRVLYEVQRLFSKFRRASPDREYRLVGAATRVGKWRIRLLPEADRAASP